jgi:hypothetical protein
MGSKKTSSDPSRLKRLILTTGRQTRKPNSALGHRVTGLAHVCELADGETARVSVSGDLACGDEAEENHLRVAGIGTGTVSDGGSPSTFASSSLGGVGGMTFITGGCVVSGIGGTFRAESMGGGGSSAGRSLLARLEGNDDVDVDEGANQARFLGISLVSDSG